MAASVSPLQPFTGGRVDVCMIGYPFGLNAKERGLQLALSTFPDRIWSVFLPRSIAAREGVAQRRQEPQDRGRLFTRASNEGQQLAREKCRGNQAGTAEILPESMMTASLQGSFEYYKDAFPSSLRVIEKAMANALKFVDHPKAKTGPT